MTGYGGVLKQAATAVLLFLFLTGAAYGGVADDLENGKSLQDVVADSLAAGTPINDLVADLIAANQDSKEIICTLFSKGADKVAVIGAALDNGMNKQDVVDWSYQCGATRSDVQDGFSMAGEGMPPASVYRQTDKIEENTQEYNYNPPSPSQ
jgi:hypothetical protein